MSLSTAIFIFLSTWLLTSDLQSSTAIVNQLPGQLVSIHSVTMHRHIKSIKALKIPMILIL